MRATRKARDVELAGPPKPPARVIAERIISILEIPWRDTGTEYFYIANGQLVDEDAGAVLRVGIHRTGWELPEISALTREVDALLATSPDPILQFELL